MRNLTLDELQALLDEDAGLSQSSINNDALLIKALYGYAMERDIVGKDYSRYLDVPSVGAKRPRDALNDLQLAKLTTGGGRLPLGGYGPHALLFGVPDATPHWCRHTFATRLHTAKADPLTVK